MTTPGQQGAAAASRARQATADSHYLARRNQHGRPRGGGFFGLIGRLIGLVFTLVVVAIAAGIFLMILGQASPDLFNQLKTWF